jgi:hypothetical protein
LCDNERERGEREREKGREKGREIEVLLLLHQTSLILSFKGDSHKVCVVTTTDQTHVFSGQFFQARVNVLEESVAGFFSLLRLQELPKANVAFL